MKNKVDEYIDYLISVKNSTKNTVDSYRRDLYKMSGFMYENGICHIEKVKYTNINSYILYLEKEGKSSSTIARNISAMKSFFHFMLSKGYISKEPTELIVPPKADNRPVGINSIEIVDKLLKAPRGNNPIPLRDKAMLELLYATGMRVSELVRLTVSDINMTMDYVTCKNNKTERIVPFGSRAKKAVEKYLINGRPYLDKDGLCHNFFLNCHGRPLSRQGFWKILKEYANKAGIKEEITPHTIRHSFGAHMISNGADLKAVQEMMGHIDIASTQVYLSSSQKSIREVYNKSHPRI